MRPIALCFAALVFGGAAHSAPPSAMSAAAHLRPVVAAALPDKATVLYQKAQLRLTPSGRAWVAAQSEKLRNGSLDASLVEAESSGACATALNGCAGQPDVEALAFLVLMQTAADMNADLKGIMAEVKAKNAAKAQMRGAMAQRMVRTVTAEQINADIARTKNDLDTMSEMGEMESMRLQMAMDRLSKLMSTLSNVLKKMSDTDQGITQNLK